MTAKEKLEVIVRALDMKRGENIQVLEISDLTILADYFVIVNGTSNTHVKTLADEAEFKLLDHSGLWGHCSACIYEGCPQSVPAGKPMGGRYSSGYHILSD